MTYITCIYTQFVTLVAVKWKIRYKMDDVIILHCIATLYSPFPLSHYIIYVCAQTHATRSTHAHSHKVHTRRHTHTKTHTYTTHTAHTNTTHTHTHAHTYTYTHNTHTHKHTYIHTHTHTQN